MAADGAATYGTASGQRTIRQSTQKLQIVRDQVLVGTAGPVGLGQLIKDTVHDLSRGGAFSGRGATPPDVMRKLRDELWEDVGRALKMAATAKGILGHNARSSALSDTLVALWIHGEPALIHIDPQCAPEAASKDLPFMAIGSGQSIADPFLAFLRRTFWPDEAPTLAEGVFVACWTLDHAVETHPGGVAEPIEIAVLKPDDNGDPVAHKLEDEILDEHHQQVESAREHLREFSEDIAGILAAGEEEVEAPPEPEE